MQTKPGSWTADQGPAHPGTRPPLAATLLPAMLAGLAIALAACTTPMAGDDPTIPAGDYQMAAAIAEARRTLPDFLTVVASPPADTLGFRLRISATDGDRREFVWVMPFQALPDGGFEGTAAEQPSYLSNVREGQVIRFERSAIVDWGYTANGHDIGSRTVCVMLNRMPKERADPLRREHRMSC